MSFELILFWAFGFLALFSALAMVCFVRHLVAAAMSLLVTMVSLAGIYVLMHAELIAVIQILVYAGAIVVVFLFVLMLLDLRGAGLGPPPRGQAVVKVVGVGGTVAIAALLVVKLSGTFALTPLPEALPKGFGGHQAMGIALFTEYALLVELVGLVLLAAIIGAVILAKRRID
jgi:NADH-quinone oxidoreductase subunit J